MIIGTAGHIDHGKTTLVRALTGVDTDRLPEEKARGISISLGYAYLPAGNGDILGFVDVPGHERFVHTMVAGATGIDYALLVVAADDGAMPQTHEHLDILSLLGVDAGAIVLTKVDRVDPSRVTQVGAELRALAAQTPLANAPMFEVSGRTGAGIDALRTFLQARSLDDRSRANTGHFRLAVDRSFTLPGIGTVVTGAVHSGEVRVGSSLVVAPRGREVRVRGIHAQNRESDRAVVGQRCAICLAGIDRNDVARGDWVVAPDIASTTERFDARVTLLAGDVTSLRSGVPVHIHLGAAHVAGRLVALDEPIVAAGGSDDARPRLSGRVQIVLQQPTSAWLGDRFIVRNAQATRTIGGGRVLDPFAPARYRRSADRMAVLAALEEPDHAARLAALVEQMPFGLDLHRYTRACNVQNVERMMPGLGVRSIAGNGVDFAVSGARWQALQLQAVETLSTFHRDHPDEPGPDVPRLKRMAFPRLPDSMFRSLVSDLIAAGKFRQDGPWLQVPGHSNAPSAQERALVETLLPWLAEANFNPPWVRDLARDLAQAEAAVRTALIRASKRGEAFQVVHDLFFHPAAIRSLAEIASGLQSADGEVRAASFRDRTGLGRKRAIQVLEFFDRVGFTRRVADRHLVRTDNLLALDRAPAVARERPASEHRTA